MRASTRIYTGPRTTTYGAVVASQWSSKVGMAIDGSLIVSGTVTAAKIVTGSLTAAQIADATITGAKIQNSTIDGSTKIVQGSMTADRIQPSTFSLTNNGTTLDLLNGRVVFDDGTRSRIMGTGFGSTNQFTDFYGTSGTPGTRTETDAVWYIKKNGDSYFGGALGLKSGKTTGSITILSGSYRLMTGAAATITAPTGGSVEVAFTFEGYNVSNGTNTGQTYYLQLRRNGTAIWTRSYTTPVILDPLLIPNNSGTVDISKILVDTPPAGSCLYELYCYKGQNMTTYCTLGFVRAMLVR